MDGRFDANRRSTTDSRTDGTLADRSTELERGAADRWNWADEGCAAASDSQERTDRQ